jgi:hypothetical protein
MKIIDYLQQEIDAAEARKAATKAGKRARCAELAKRLMKVEPA